MGTNKNEIYYVNFRKIKKFGYYVSYWLLIDFLKPLDRELSHQYYKQSDCKSLRYKSSSIVKHKRPMGRGTSKTTHFSRSSRKKWFYSIIDKHVTKIACDKLF